jgi:hypothetical protein
VAGWQKQYQPKTYFANGFEVGCEICRELRNLACIPRICGVTAWFERNWLYDWCLFGIVN